MGLSEIGSVQATASQPGGPEEHNQEGVQGNPWGDGQEGCVRDEEQSGQDGQGWRKGLWGKDHKTLNEEPIFIIIDLLFTIYKLLSKKFCSQS